MMRRMLGGVAAAAWSSGATLIARRSRGRRFMRGAYQFVILSAAKNPCVRSKCGVRARGVFAPLRMTEQWEFGGCSKRELRLQPPGGGIGNPRGRQEPVDLATQAVV